MTTEEIRDLLLEAGRYSRTDPDVAARLARQAAAYMESHSSRGSGWYRLADNLRVGARFVRVAPGVLAGYCDAASFEMTTKAAGGSAPC